MEIIWSPQSLKDLEDIGDFIAKDSPARATKFVNEILLSVNQLEKFPESGALVEYHPIFRQILHRGYRLIYQIKSTQILIITVLGPGQKV